MKQLKITKSITNRESASLDKYLQEIGREDLIVVEEEVELVGGAAAVSEGVEGEGEEAVGDGGGGDFDGFYGAAADDNAWEVGLSVGGDMVFVELAEDGVGAVVFPDGQPVEADEVGFLHVGGEF